MNAAVNNISGLKPQARMTAISAAILLASFAVLYRGVLTDLVRDWLNDDNYSHGFFIIPVAIYFAVKSKSRLRSAVSQPSSFGLLLIVLSLGILLAGILGSELFLTRISMLGIIGGAVLFLYGWRHLRILLFPILFLVLMIPIPAILFNQIAFPLQLIASRFGETVLTMIGVPVLREGNLIRLANTTLEVVDACSGIRSLVSLLTLSIVFGYFMDPRIWVRFLLALATPPIAIFANGLRVSFTGVASYYFGAEAAEGFTHTFSGWLIFLIAFFMIFVLHRLIVWASPSRQARQTTGSRP